MPSILDWFVYLMNSMYIEIIFTFLHPIPPPSLPIWLSSADLDIRLTTIGGMPGRWWDYRGPYPDGLGHLLTPGMPPIHWAIHPTSQSDWPAAWSTHV